MSKRLQVLLKEAELQRMRRIAKQKGLTLSEWVRQLLREASRREGVGSAERKLAVVRAAATHEFPTADIDEMLADIDRGYAGGSTP